MRNTIQTPRMLRTGKPLTLEQIRSVAPAVFAEEAHHSRSDRYAYIPTIRPLEALLDSGWQVWEVSQQRSRAADRDPYTKHMLRLRKSDEVTHYRNRDGDGEIVITNGHDGTASYSVSAGFFRLVCSNGMVVGKTLGAIRVQHTKSLATSEAVLKASEDALVQKVPRMLEQIEMLRAADTDEEQRRELARTAIELRYRNTVSPVTVEAVLQARREVDAANNMWTVLNRIQENIIDGGWYTTSMFMGRRSMVRPVERVSANLAINAGLWDRAVELVTE